MKIRTEVTVDLMQPDPLPVVKAKQGDSCREVAVTLRADSSIVIPDAVPKIYIKKPDGTKIYNVCTMDGEKVVVPLRTQSLAVAGEAEAEIQILDDDGKLSTPIFRLLVYPTNIDNEAIESSNEFGALETALGEIEVLKKTGLVGDKGDAATVQIGTVTTLPARSVATVTNVGTQNAAILDFGIPKGEQGDIGGNAEYEAEDYWTENDPVLPKGRIAASSDKDGMYKIGDGESKWSALDYNTANAAVHESLGHDITKHYVHGIYPSGGKLVAEYGDGTTADVCEEVTMLNSGDEIVNTDDEEAVAGALGTKEALEMMQENLEKLIPTKVSVLENDSNFLTEVPVDYPTKTEINGMLVRESVGTGAKSFAVGYSGDCSLSISKDGYTPIGIIGFKTNNATVVMSGAYLQNAVTIGYAVRNVGTAEASTSIVFHVLWAKKL